MSNSVVAVRPETLLVPLPAKPDWFDRELARVATRDDRPVFKVVDGQRELKWRNGKRDVKHLLQHDNVSCYVPVIRTVFRRMDTSTWKPKYYASKEEAENDSQISLEKEITWTHIVSTRAIGRACWVVEVYVSPTELDPEAWEAMRYAEMDVSGVPSQVDVLGEYPREGMYAYAFSVLDDEGNAIPPNQRTLDECKRRWKHMCGEEKKSLEQAIKEHDDREDRFEKKEIARITDSFYQYHGISANRFHHGVVSRPITAVKEGTKIK